MGVTRERSPHQEVILSGASEGKVHTHEHTSTHLNTHTPSPRSFDWASTPRHTLACSPSREAYRSKEGLRGLWSSHADKHTHTQERERDSGDLNKRWWIPKQRMDWMITHQVALEAHHSRIERTLRYRRSCKDVSEQVVVDSAEVPI